MEIIKLDSILHMSNYDYLEKNKQNKQTTLATPAFWAFLALIEPQFALQPPDIEQGSLQGQQYTYSYQR